MGMESYASRTPYQAKVSDALNDLQKQVFANKEYRFADIDEAASIDEARAYAAEDGTASVLDIIGISEEISDDELPQEEIRYFLSRALNEDELMSFFGKARLTIDDIEAINNNASLWESIDRGQSRYIILYEADKPQEYYFIGYSFD